MRRVSLVAAVIAAMATAYVLGKYYHRPPGGSTERRVAYYVDPMHPSYRSDRPGTAPDCGMPLEPVYTDDSGRALLSSGMNLAPGAVSIDSATLRLLGIQVAAVERSEASCDIHVVGRVVAEDTRVYRINPGADGFIRETFNDSVGTQVKKDQKLAMYYAPEFVAAASGYLAASERITGALAREGARSVSTYSDRLRNLGMSDVQIRAMTESRQLPDSIDVVAPADGFIVARNITPGQHFERNMEFYRIADLRQVWVVAEVYEQEAQVLRPGAMAMVSMRDGARKLPARVAASLPQSEAGGGTVKLRLEVDNPGFVLRPDMLVDVDVPIRRPAAVTVPLDALVDSGSRSRVYVERAEGIFEPRAVATGWRTAERAQIRDGLRPGERVVVAATFLVDSESRLKAPDAQSAQPAPATAPMAAEPSLSPGVKDPSCGMPVDPAKAVKAGNTLVSGGTTYYFCSRQCKETFQNKRANAADKRSGDDDD